MPEIARFFGIIIHMFAEAGVPHHYPHIHVYYQNHVSIYRIDVIELINGGLPLKQQRLVEAWMELHHGELVENWDRLQLGHLPYKIAPLK